ncbi:MAG: hypothetical protein JSU08_11300 [Acidobacteria bacterium]|nr:hypothetical protein [Acidobacteriota bacterium]
MKPDPLDTPRAVLARFRDRGLEFRVEGNRLRVLNGWRTLPREDRAVIERHRSALIVLVAAEQQNAASTPPAPPEPARPAIAPAEYGSLGLYVLNGVVTHALGDQFAADVIAGRISRSEALDMQQTAERTKRALRNAKPWRI